MMNNIIKLTKETIKRFHTMAVKVVNVDDVCRTGYFIIEKDRYLLLPLDDIWRAYSYKFSHIKSIMYLTNGCELKK